MEMDRSYVDVCSGRLDGGDLHVQNSLPGGEQMTVILPNEERYLECFGRRFLHVPIRGDGNCFFRAIARLLYGDQERHGHVRAELMTFCNINWAKYRFILRKHYPEYNTRDRYVNYMGQDAIYGGHPELIAASECYGIPISVYNKASSNFLTENASGSSDAGITLWYDFAVCHYEALEEFPIFSDENDAILPIVDSELSWEEEVELHIDCPILVCLCLIENWLV